MLTTIDLFLYYRMLLLRVPTRSTYWVTLVLLVAIAVYLQSGQADVSHIQHKIRLKKLAKLALAAKFITHTIIPIPIPLPIIKRHKHKQEQYKATELEAVPWKGDWNYGEGRGGPGGWELGDAGVVGGWEGRQIRAEWNHGGFGRWSPYIDGHLKKVEIKEAAPFQAGHAGGHKVTVKQIVHNAGGNNWITDGGHMASVGYDSYNPRQIEVQEEILPALKVAGFVKGSDGELTKVVENDAQSNDGWAGFQGSWPSQGREVSGARLQIHGWRSKMKSEELKTTQTAEVLETKEVGYAKIMHASPFDVESAKLGGFDVSDVPVQAMRAPPVKTSAEIMPWPTKVVSSHMETDYANNKAYSSSDHEATDDTHLEAAVDHLNLGDAHILSLRNHLNIEPSDLHRNYGIHQNLHPTEVAHHKSSAHNENSYNEAFIKDDEKGHQDGDDSHLHIGFIAGIPYTEPKTLHRPQATGHGVTMQTNDWNPTALSQDSKRQISIEHDNNKNDYRKDTEDEGKQEDAEKWLDAH
ncbi:uncharacterized protein LOC111265294 isoform X2 [Varroa jacobsoni]|uniref:uncharacterized protein LOC111265294 isoform X2 n=2 Tax=Varroa jacobsoni TaxID=62625 RepID=UPI000BF4AA50|nr:uncharacterized protein LOC111265294 isoform X2 [Varroa jacobsoni]